MVVKVNIYSRTPNEVMDIVRDLRHTGLAQGKDFDFKYTPGGYDADNWERKESVTEFSFYTEKYATFFTLKYS